MHSFLVWAVRLADNAVKEVWVSSDNINGIVGRGQVCLERPVEEALVGVGDTGGSRCLGPSNGFLLRRCGRDRKDQRLGGCWTIF